MKPYRKTQSFTWMEILAGLVLIAVIVNTAI
jgi:hypothetical protein